MYCVYVLRSLKDGLFYTGFTKNLDARLQRHNGGLVTSTKYRKPFELVYYEASLSIKDSMKREVYLKTAWGKRYIKNRINNYLNGPNEIAKHLMGSREVRNNATSLGGR